MQSSPNNAPNNGLVHVVQPNSSTQIGGGGCPDRRRSSTTIGTTSVRELDSLQGEVNRLFDTFFGNAGGHNGGARTRRWVPAMDLVETKNELVLGADLPGMEQEDIAIEVKDGVLTLVGERKAEQTEEADGFLRVERSFGAFSRSLSLPDGIDAEQVAAEFDKGVLEVRIPKPEERKPHRVAIGSSPAALEGSAEER